MRCFFSVYFSRLLIVLLLGALAKTSLAQSCPRDLALQAYTVGFAETQTTSAQLAWTGNTSNCEAGQISAIAQLHALTRLNYLRSIVGLPPVSFDSTLNAKAQAAALMMHAQNALNHYPDSSYACYTAAGDEAAGKSNLYLGRWGASAIVGYVEDPGSNNAAVGHRRWILYPRAKIFGHGFTNRADALWVIGNTGPRPASPEFVAWPSPGYHPSDLVFPRWSFSMPSANFNATRIQLTGPSGEVISNTKLATTNGFGDNTLVWEPTPGSYNTRPSEDKTYVVQLDSVLVGGNMRSFTYTVTMFNPLNSGCLAGFNRNPSSCQCERTNSIKSLTAPQYELAFRSGLDELYFTGQQTIAGATILVVDVAGRTLIAQPILLEGTVSLKDFGSGIYYARVIDSAGRELASRNVAVHE